MLLLQRTEQKKRKEEKCDASNSRKFLKNQKNLFLYMKLSIRLNLNSHKFATVQQVHLQTLLIEEESF